MPPQGLGNAWTGLERSVVHTGLILSLSSFTPLTLHQTTMKAPESLPKLTLAFASRTWPCDLIGDLARSVPTLSISSFRLACWISSGDTPYLYLHLVCRCMSLDNERLIDHPSSCTSASLHPRMFLDTPLACYNPEISMFRDQSLASRLHALSEAPTASPPDSIRPSSEHIMVPGGFTCAILRAW